MTDSLAPVEFEYKLFKVTTKNWYRTGEPDTANVVCVVEKNGREFFYRFLSRKSKTHLKLSLAYTVETILSRKGMGSGYNIRTSMRSVNSFVVTLPAHGHRLYTIELGRPR
jgi:hypothetical protein